MFKNASTVTVNPVLEKKKSLKRKWEKRVVKLKHTFPSQYWLFFSVTFLATGSRAEQEFSGVQWVTGSVTGWCFMWQTVLVMVQQPCNGK